MADVERSTNEINFYPIVQATNAVFPDLYLRQTFLFFIEQGAKRVLDTAGNEWLAEEGDMLIFPPDSFVTMENRPVMEKNYRATGISYSAEAVASIFPLSNALQSVMDVQIIRSEEYESSTLVPLLKNSISNEQLPESIRHHRLLEPLIWLKQLGIQLPQKTQVSLLSRVREVIDSDLSQSWQAAEVASRLAMSESTFRRRMVKEGQSFSKVLLNSRLECGLNLLQTTSRSISEIAYESGFKTPSHFSDVFKKRFGIPPKNIRSAEDD